MKGKYLLIMFITNEQYRDLINRMPLTHDAILDERTHIFVILQNGSDEYQMLFHDIVLSPNKEDWKRYNEKHQLPSFISANKTYWVLAPADTPNEHSKIMTEEELINFELKSKKVFAADPLALSKVYVTYSSRVF